MRSTCSQVLGSVLGLLPFEKVVKISHLLHFLAHQKQWEIQFSSLLAIQHLLAVRQVTGTIPSNQIAVYTLQSDCCVYPQSDCCVYPPIRLLCIPSNQIAVYTLLVFVQEDAETLLPVLTPAILVGLQEGGDDVKGAAASALLPVSKCFSMHLPKEVRMYRY